MNAREIEAARILEEWLSEIILHWDPIWGEPVSYWRSWTHEFLGIGPANLMRPTFHPPERVRVAYAGVAMT